MNLESNPVMNDKERLADEAAQDFAEKLKVGFESLTHVQAEVLAAASHIAGEEKALECGYGSAEKVNWEFEGTWINLPGNSELPLTVAPEVTIENFDQEAFKQALLSDTELVG